MLGLFVLASLLQLIAWWGGLGKLAFQASKPSQKAEIYAPVSVVICARNEAENLRKYLPAILAQQFEFDWELIVVEDASMDDSAQVLQAFQLQFPQRLQVLWIAEKTAFGKKQALSQGISMAKYNHILLTDADCEPQSAHWLKLMSAALCARPDTEIVLGYGPIRRANWVIASNWPRFEAAMVAAQYCAFALAGQPYMGVGRNLAFKKTVFDRLGGFQAHANLISGDDDLFVNAAANARNTVVCLDPDTFMYSNAPSDFKAWLRQKQRHLSASPAYRVRHKLFLGILALSQAGQYGLFFLLILTGNAPVWAFVLFFLRLFSIQWIFRRILKTLRASDLTARIVLFDVLMALNLALIVPWFLIPRKAQTWN